MELRCHHCGNKLEVGERVGRAEACRHCGYDLHVCYNCQHYDRTAYNECRESQAEWVLEKDRANFCDYFFPSDASPFEKKNKQDEIKAKLDSLFKKNK